MGLVSWLLGGLIVGVVAQLLVRGDHGLGCVGTIGLGILGSFVGGTLWNAATSSGVQLRTGGFIASVVGAVLLLVLGRLLSPPVRR